MYEIKHQYNLDTHILFKIIYDTLNM
jgi:hypothetical protein